MILPPGLWALPQGGQVVAGQAGISQQAGATAINQISDRAVINWKGFNIGANELVQFMQPGAGSIALNRILGGNASQILGQLKANGRVFIVNPRGVLFGSTARVDVAGLLATTLDTDNADFMNGDFRFEKVDGVDASFIVNAGRIEVGTNGFAFLVAPTVDNQGLIVAKLGTVALASGDTLTLDFRGNGLVTYAVSGNLAEQVVKNGGTISNPGGQVVLSAESGPAVLTSVVNNDGMIEAQSLVERNGKVVFTGGDGAAWNAGSIDVSGAEEGAAGGEVEISGRFAGTAGSTDATGAGAADGGRVTISSERHSLVADAATIDVSGGHSGTGGTVALLSLNRSTLNGQIGARGGDQTGDGGFVDVSSPGEVELRGQVDASAPNGKTGTLLIDPKNIEVNNAGGAAYADGANNQFANDPDGTVNDPTIITATSINGQGADVVLQANTDITVSSAISISSANTALTMQAGRSVRINADISTNDGTIAITANDPTAQAANRDAGVGEIVMAAGTTVDADGGSIVLTTSANGHGDAGGVTVDRVTTDGSLTINSYGAIREADTDDEVDLRANILTLVTTDPAGAAIGAPGTSYTDPIEIHTGTRLDITTTGGYVALHRPSTDLPLDFFAPQPLDDPLTTDIDESKVLDFGLGTVDLGAATLVLTVTDGSLLDANAGAGAPNVTATGATLTTTGADADALRGGTIGTAGQPIRTAVDILSAISTNNSVFVNETDEIVLSTVEAKQQNVPAKLTAAGVVATRPTGQTVVGVNDVMVTAGGSIGVGVVTATNDVTLTSGDAIYDTNQELANITAPDVILTAPNGIGQEPAEEGLALDTTLNTVTANSASGGVFVSNRSLGTVEFVQVAAGGGNDVYLANTQGALSLGQVVANGGDVTVHGGDGTIVDGNAAGANIVGASASIICSNQVGSDADPIETTVDGLSVEIIEEGQSFVIAESDTLDTISVKVNNGSFDLSFTGGAFDFDATTSTFSASGAPSVSFENTGGDVAVGTVDAPTSVTIVASGAITDAGSALTAATATLTAGTTIGGAGSELNTDVDTLVIEAGEGTLHIREADDVTLTAVAQGTGSDVDVATANAGDISVVKISADDEVKLEAGGSILADAQTTRLSGTSATLTAGSAIGTVADPLETVVSTLSATANAGRLSLENYGDLALTSATATGGDLELRNSGTMTLNTVAAAGQTATVHSNGTITDGNGAALNILADTLFLSSGLRIGAPGAGNAVDVDVASLNVPPTYGAVYINHLGAAALNVVSIEAVGSGSDVELTAAGDIALGLVSAKGDDVVIVSGNAITDANGPSVNVIADILDITGPGGIGLADPLETQVNQVSSSGDAVIANDGPLALTEAALEGGSSAFIAETITILDIADNQADLVNDVSLDLSTPAGHIVFLDTNDKIVASGTGTVRIDAGSATAGSGGVAIIGDIEAADSDIAIMADSHISIGLLDAGAGDISVLSNTGVILDGNGALDNIIARNLSLRGRLPTAREAELHTTNSIGDAHAHDSEAATKKTLQETTDATAVVLEQAEQMQIQMRDAKQVELDDITAEVDALAARVAPLAKTIEVMERTVQGMTIAADVLNLAGSIAQAIPQTGDGGLLGTAAAFETGIGVVETSLFYADIAYEILAEDLEDLEATQAELAAQLYTHEQLTDYSIEASRAADEAVSISSAAYEAAVVVQGLTWQVARQAVAAEDIGNAIGTGNQNFGTQITGTVDAVADRSDIYIGFTGAGKLGTLTASNTASNAKIEVLGDGDISVDGTVTAQSLIRIETTGGAIMNGGGSVTSSEFLALATTGVGTGVGLNSSVDMFAAAAGTGGVGLANDKALVIGTVDGTSGVTGSSVDIAAGGLNQIAPIVSTGPVVITTISTATSTVDGIRLADIQAAGQTVVISATGTATAAITDNNDGDRNILASDLAMTATAGVGTAANALETEVSNLAAEGGTGGVTIDNTGDLNLQTVGGVTTLSATGGAIALSTTGNLSISDAFVRGAGLEVSLTATDGSIVEINTGAAADIVGDTINLVVTGVASTIGTGGETLEIDGALLNASTESGSIWLEDTAGGISVGLVDAAGASNGSVIELTATGGSILDSSGVDADLIAESLLLTVTGVASTIGTGLEPLEIAGVNLSAFTSGGSIYLVDLDGGIIIDELTTLGVDGSTINLTALGGSILETEPGDPDIDIWTHLVELTVTGVDSVIGAKLNPIEIRAPWLKTTGGRRSSISDPEDELELVTTGLPPTSLIIVDGQVIGGGRIRSYTQALAVLRPYELVERFLSATPVVPVAGELILPPEDSMTR